MGANAHVKEASKYKVIKISRGCLRPFTSLKGPINNCPNPNPNKQDVKLICTSEAVVSKSFTIVGKDGKYVSIVKGPNSPSDPKSIASCIRFFPLGLINVHRLSKNISIS